MAQTTQIKRTCPLCKTSYIMEVDADAYYRYIHDGILIQKAFPHMSDDEREMIITGIHPKCWDQAFEEEGLDDD